MTKQFDTKSNVKLGGFYGDQNCKRIHSRLWEKLPQFSSSDTEWKDKTNKFYSKFNMKKTRKKGKTDKGIVFANFGVISGDLTQSPVNKLEHFGGMVKISSVVD